MVASVFVSNTTWTFWDVFFLFFIFIPLVMIWFFCILDVFRRLDLSGWGKAAWLVGIIVFPWLGSLAYLIFRPADVYAYGPAYERAGSGYGSAAAGSESPPAGQVPTA